MHLKKLTCRQFRRFADLTISVPSRPKLVILCGPNGVGKSSIADALQTWRGSMSWGFSGAPDFFDRNMEHTPLEPVHGRVSVAFHEAFDNSHNSESIRKSVYVRTAHRNDPEFVSQAVGGIPSLLDAGQEHQLRSIDNDARVAVNYQRLIGQSVGDLFSGERDELSVRELRASYTDRISLSMNRLFPDLTYEGPGDPFNRGTFRFGKGTSRGFAYMSLSGGEKAAFDLIIDLIVKLPTFDDTTIFIDEPEIHMNTRVQAGLLREICQLVNSRSQLWIATHSIGMLKEARKMQEEDPSSVAFLDFEGRNFDGTVHLEPVTVDRDFWRRTLSVAIGDLAELIAPSRIVLCEGRPVAGKGADEKAQFDARCYRTIFGQSMPETEFASVGGGTEVAADRLKLGASMEMVLSNTEIVRLVDRDERSSEEIADLKEQGVTVLARRTIESYLLDDEVLRALCAEYGRPEAESEVSSSVAAALKDSVERGNPDDDLKRAASQAVNAIKRILDIKQGGTTTFRFLSDTVAPVIRPHMQIFTELKRDIFGALAEESAGQPKA